jgi:putative acetyltransferase
MTSTSVSPVQAEDFPQVLEVWEASVRATHDFISEADIQFFKPLVRDVLPQMPVLTCVRDQQSQVVGFLGLEADKIEMLFIDPQWRGKGIGRSLLASRWLLPQPGI